MTLRAMMMRGAFLLALGLALPGIAQHQAQPGVADKNQHGPMADRDGIVSWKLLAQVEMVKVKGRVAPVFSNKLAALDTKKVKIQGFMLPLQTGLQQTHFVLSAMPPTCSFCVPAGPEQLIEVKTTKSVNYTFEPVVISGKLTLLKDDPSGVFYRLTDAVQTQ
jgi:hypothetical protein